MQFLITKLNKNIISEISTKAPSKSPVIPEKVLMQKLLHEKYTAKNPKKITGSKNPETIHMITKKILSLRFRASPSERASPSFFAKSRLFNKIAIPKREKTGTKKIPDSKLFENISENKAHFKIKIPEQKITPKAPTCESERISRRFFKSLCENTASKVSMKPSM